MALHSYNWRHRWRGRGIALDRLLPVCFGTPAPALDTLPGRVAKYVVVPQDGRLKLDTDDVGAVIESADFTLSFVAEFLPVQIVEKDASVSSNLAVQAMPGEAEGTYVGSFDLIARIFAANTQPWARFNRVDMAIDC